VSRRLTLQKITERVRAGSVHALIHEGDGLIVVESHYRSDTSDTPWVARGVAKCAPGDTYDFDTGWQRATRRATTKIARRVYAKQEAELKGAYRLARKRLVKATDGLRRCMKCDPSGVCAMETLANRKKQFVSALGDCVEATDALLEEVWHED